MQTSRAFDLLCLARLSLETGSARTGSARFRTAKAWLVETTDLERPRTDREAISLPTNATLLRCWQAP
jgi:hypothetical protein